MDAILVFNQVLYPGITNQFEDFIFFSLACDAFYQTLKYVGSPRIRSHLDEVADAWDELEFLSTSYLHCDALHEVVPILVDHQTICVSFNFTHNTLIGKKSEMARNYSLQKLAANLACTYAGES